MVFPKIFVILHEFLVFLQIKVVKLVERETQAICQFPWKFCRVHMKDLDRTCCEKNLLLGNKANDLGLKCAKCYRFL